MYDDPLYVEIMRDTKRGDTFTTEDAQARWGRTGQQTYRVLDWMAGAQNPQSMRKLPGAPPQLWERI